MKGKLRVALFCAVAIPLAQSAAAQPAHDYVIMVHLKPDMVNDWIDLQKNEVIPALKKGGISSVATYQTVIGNTNEYLMVWPLEKYAELDGQNPITRALGAEGYARLRAKLARCYESREVFIGTPQPGLSTAPATTSAPFAVFTRRRIAAGKLEEYQNFVKMQVMPLWKKVSAPVSVLRRGLGANSSDFVQVNWLDKLADLDAGPPATRALGEAGAAKLAAAEAPIAPIVEQVVRRRVPELSY